MTLSLDHKRVALAGNPNTGKTTLFNRLTGGHAKVGNYPGITVERQEASVELDGVRVGADRVMGTPGASAPTLARVLEEAAVAICRNRRVPAGQEQISGSRSGWWSRAAARTA